jgi:hypothetical protein
MFTRTPPPLFREQQEVHVAGRNRLYEDTARMRRVVACCRMRPANSCIPSASCRQTPVNQGPDFPSHGDSICTSPYQDNIFI